MNYQSVSCCNGMSLSGCTKASLNHFNGFPAIATKRYVVKQCHII